jgi:2-succinyl-6-hydroxy-2,4-cyclohexadiene-1-carboxylate synthase
MHVERLGVGDVSIVLHGFAGSGQEMLDLARRLPGRKLVVDLPGHGRTAASQDPAAYRMETIVEALIGILDDDGIERADVIGYSMGGRVALGLAAFAPERVTSVVAIGARTGIADDDERGARRAADNDLAAAIEERGVEWFANEWIGKAIYDTQRTLGDDHMARVLELRLGVDPSGVAHSLRELGAGAQPVITGRLAESAVPVALIVGEADDRFTAIANQIADVVPTARVIVVPGAGHAAHVEAPSATAGAIVAFWEGGG